MTWDRVLRFVAEEDGQEYLGQPVDGSLDVGKAHEAGQKVEVQVIKGSLFDESAEVTSERKTVKQVL